MILPKLHLWMISSSTGIFSVATLFIAIERLAKFVFSHLMNKPSSVP